MDSNLYRKQLAAKLNQLANSCHVPSGPGGGQFCGDHLPPEVMRVEALGGRGGTGATRWGKGKYYALDDKTARIYRDEAERRGAEDIDIKRVESKSLLVKRPLILRNVKSTDTIENALTDFLGTEVRKTQRENARKVGKNPDVFWHDSIGTILATEGYDSLIILTNETGNGFVNVGGNQLILFDQGARNG